MDVASLAALASSVWRTRTGSAGLVVSEGVEGLVVSEGVEGLVVSEGVEGLV